jgi:hypothetical protein
MRKKAPPALLLQDADDVVSAQQTRLLDSQAAGCSNGAGAEANADADVSDGLCFTPHAPSEGGKVNAIMMRKLGKGKSLRRLEEVMLMVAAHAADVEGGGW